MLNTCDHAGSRWPISVNVGLVGLGINYSRRLF